MFLESLESRHLLASDFSFANTFGSTSNDIARAVAVDSAGNSYVTGEFRFAVDFDAGPGSALLQELGGGSGDVFIAKYRPDSSLAWVRQIGGASVDLGFDIAVDGSGNVVVGGFFLREIDLDPGPATATRIAAPFGSSDLFVLKLDTNGNFLWGNSFGSATGAENLRAVTVDTAGNVYATGQFSGSGDFDPNPSSTLTLSTTSSSDNDVFISKFGPSGNLVWARNFGNTNSGQGDEGRGLAVDSAGFIYTSGRFRGDASLNRGAATGQAMPFSSTSDNPFVTKHDPNGNLVWARAFSATASSHAEAVSLDPAGNVVVAGSFQFSIDLDPSLAASQTVASAGSYDAFVAKLNSSGNLIWAHRFGGTGSDEIYDLDVNAAGQTLTTGQFGGTVDFDPGPGTFPLTSTPSVTGANVDSFVSILNSDGSFAEALSFGGPALDRGHGIAMVGAAIYVAGEFAVTADFHSGADVRNRTSAGGPDGFLLRLAPVTPVVPGSISGVKWSDTDGDGVQDPGEPPLAGVVIYIDQNNNGQLDGGAASPTEPVAITDSSGAYTFANLSPGDYTIREIVPDGYVQTSPDAQRDYYVGYDPSSRTLIEIDALTGAVSRIPLAASGTGINFQGVVVNRNGQTYGLDANARILFSIDRNSGEVTPAVITDGGLARGLAYDPTTDTIYGLALGPSGWSLVALDPESGQATPVGAAVSTAQLSNPHAMTFDPTTGRVVVYDLSGADFWSFGAGGPPTMIGVTSLNAPTLAHNGGSFVAFAGFGSSQLVRVTPGSPATPLLTLSQSVLSESLDFVRATPFAHNVALVSGANVTNVNFGNRFVLGEIHGAKWIDADGDGVRDAGEAPMEGMTVYIDVNNDGVLQASEPNVVTAADGSYSFTGLAPATYVVREVLPAGYVQSAPGAQNDYYYGFDVSGARNQLVKIDAVSGHVTRIGPGGGVQLMGLVRTNAGELFGIAGNSLYRVDPDTGETTVVAPGGIALGPGLAYDSVTDTIYALARSGSSHYLATINPTTGIATPIGPGVLGINSPHGAAWDPAGQRLVVYDNFNDTLWAFDRQGIGSQIGAVPSMENISLAYNGSTLVGTRLSGSIQSLVTINPATGAVTPFATLPAGVFVSTLDFVNVESFAHVVSLGLADVAADVDFGNQRAVGSIAGSKWIDADGDGVRDAGELPMEGVVVYVDANNDGQRQPTEVSATTDADGNYLLTEVPIGGHVVREILPANYRQTSPGMQRDFYYAIDYNNPRTLVRIDTTTGVVTRIGSGVGQQIVGLARTNSGELFGISPNLFYRINLQTGVAEEIGPIGAASGWGLAYDSETDTIWGIAARPGGGNGLVRYDRFTGAATHIGPTSFSLQNTSGIAFDDASGRIVVFDNNDDEFWSFDRNGNATLLSGSRTSVSPFGLAHHEAGLVVYDLTTRALRLINPVNNQMGPPLVVLSQTIGVDALEFVDVEAFAHVVYVQPGQTAAGNDFGNQNILGEIHGSKWNDANGDGVRDAGEGPMAGVTVYLDLNNDGALQEDEPSTQTAADGSYAFTGVQPGTYQVREIVPADYRQTSPGKLHDYYYAVDQFQAFQLVKVDALNGAVTRIGNGLGAPIVGIARTALGELYGITSGNGQLFSIDPDTGVATRIGALGRSVGGGLAYDAETDTLFTVARDNSNNFALARIDRESGLATIVGSGTPSLFNPTGIAVDPLNDRIVVFDGGGSRELVAFTRTGTPSHLGFAPVNAASLAFDGSSLVIFEGNRFSAIYPNGQRRVLAVAQESLGLSTIEHVDLEPFASTVIVPPAGSVTGVDFGNQLVLADISGTKWHDVDADGDRDPGEPGMAEVTVYLDLNNNGALDANEPSVDTAADGSYLFADVQPGTYFVREVAPFGYQQSSPGAQEDFFYAIRFRRELHRVNPTTGQSVLIGIHNGPELHGLVQTNAGELYAISGQENTLWRIDPTSGLSTRIGATGRVVAFGLAYDAATDTIYGLARPDDNNSNLTLLVTFDRETGQATPIGSPLSGLTSVTGIAFDPVGNRIIAFDNVDREFYEFTPAGVGRRLSSIGFSTGALTTDALGRVLFENGSRLHAVNPDNGQVTVLSNIFPFGIDGLEFIDNPDFAHKVFVAPATDVSGVDFGNEFVLGEIRGTKWNDLDQDGQRDPEEPGLAGVQIYLDYNLNRQYDEGEPTQWTGENGDYVFGEVMPGDYVVREIVPDSFVQSAPGEVADYYYGLHNGRELVRIEGATGLVTTLGVLNGGPNLHGLVQTNSGELFALSGWDNSLYTIDPTNGWATRIGPAGGSVAWGLAYDSATDTLYGLIRPASSSTGEIWLATFDRLTGEATTIGPGHDDLQSTLGLTFNVATQQILAFDNNGREVWAFDRQGNRELLGVFPNLTIDFGIGSDAQGNLIVKPQNSQQLLRLDLATGALTPTITLSRPLLLEAFDVVDRPDFAHSVTVGKREIVSGRDFGNYNPAPILVGVEVTPSAIDEGDSVTLVGSFADAGAEPRTVRISWGDGSEETLTLDGNVRSFSATHRYLDDGENRVRVEVIDSAGNSAATVDEPSGGDIVSPTVSVANTIPEVTASIDLAEVAEDGVVTLTIDVSDVGTLDTHTVEIDWGDGSPVETWEVPADTRTLVLSHRYLDDSPTGTASDSYTISVVATDDDGGVSETGVASVLVHNVAPEIVSLAVSSSIADPAGQGETVSIAGSFTDSGSLDSHTLLVSWGDGQTSVITLAAGSREFQANHVYAAGGIYAVTVTVLDDDGGQDAAVAESVVEGVGVVDGVLYVIGSSAADHVHITKTSSSIRVNASVLGWGSREFAASTVQRIVAYLGAGSDHVSVAGNIDLPALIDAGAGDDHIHGGRGPSTILGGDGNDHLHGGSGRDIIIGGNGADHIHGNSADDLLIAGTTAFDADLDALLAIAAEWNSSRSYQQRVANLSGSGSGDRLNGDIYLQADGPNRTVFDDLHADHLHGANGLDWYFASLDEDHEHSTNSEEVEALD